MNPKLGSSLESKHIILKLKKKNLKSKTQQVLTFFPSLGMVCFLGENLHIMKLGKNLDKRQSLQLLPASDEKGSTGVCDTIVFQVQLGDSPKHHKEKHRTRTSYHL